VDLVYSSCQQAGAKVEPLKTYQKISKNRGTEIRSINAFSACTAWYNFQKAQFGMKRKLLLK
jgi:hypothetical protein